MVDPQYDCRCGHSLDEHQAQEDGTAVCGEAGCYCGRNPLEWAQVVRCEWCTIMAPVVWCRTEKGRMMPIEPEPNPAGNSEIKFSGSGVPLVVVHGSPPGMFDDWTPYMPHHATCDMKLKTKPTRRKPRR